MRNLKKFLALVLAMMMVFSLMITANASAGFSDNSKIKADYSEATTVLSAIKVLEGYTDGSFRPEGKILRSEFAVMIYKITTGDADRKYADQLTGIVEFTDVNVKTDWFAPYVAYVHAMGYMVGYGNGTFKPRAEVTGYEVLTTLARVLGKEIPAGTPNWELTASALAGELGINAGVTESYGLPATRQMVAQLTFNTLLYSPEAGTNYTVSYEDQETGEVKVAYDGPNEMLAFAAMVANPTSTTKTTAYTKGSLAEKNFNGLHESGVASTDNFKRPTTKWVDKNNKDIVEIAEPAIATYTNGKFTGNESKGYKAADIANVYYNGTEVADATTGTTGNHIHYCEQDADTVGMWLDDNTGIKGLEISFYPNAEDNKKYDVIVREAYLGKITDVDKTTGEIELTVYEVGYMQADAGSSGGVSFAIEKNEKDEIYTALSAFTKNDYVAVYVGPGGIEAADGDGVSLIRAIERLEHVTVDITDLTVSDEHKSYSELFSDKGEYGFANEALLIPTKEEAEAEATSGDIYVDDDENSIVFKNVVDHIELTAATLYMVNGDILLVDQSEVIREGGYAYLYGVWVDGREAGKLDPGSDGYWTDQDENDLSKVEDKDKTEKEEGASGTFKVRMIMDTDGKSHEIEKAEEGADKIITEVKKATDSGKARTDGGYGALVYYTIDGSGVYHLTGIEGQPQIKGTTGALNIEQGVAEGTLPGGGGQALDVEYNDDTVFFVVTLDDKGIVVTKSTHVYFGIDNVPDTVVKDGTYVAGAQAISSTNSTGTKIEQEGCATAVLIEYSPNEVSVGAGNYFIVIDENAPTTKTKAADGTVIEYYLFNAVVNGKVKTVKVLKSYMDGGTGGKFVHNNIVFVSSVTKYKSNDVITKFEGEAVVDYLDGVAVITNSVTNVSGGNITLYDKEDVEGTARQFRASKLAVFEVDCSNCTIEKINKSEITRNNDYDCAIGMTDSTGNYLLELYVFRNVEE